MSETKQETLERLMETTEELRQEVFAVRECGDEGLKEAQLLLSRVRDLLREAR